MRSPLLAALLLAAGCPQTTTPTSRPTTTPTTTPTPRPTVGTVADPVLEVGTRFHHTCVRRKSSSVLCWGRNVYGQLGANGREDSARPVKTPITGAAELAIGRDFSCARRTAGDVLCWGNDEDGQLGGGGGGRPGALSLRPVKVAGLTRVAQVTAGEYHACALEAGGVVSCWGNAGNGQIGSDAQRAFNRPQRISPLQPASHVASGANHVCAVEQRGTVQCWGRNTEGQLGDGKSGSRIKPVQVAGIEDAIDLGSGHNHTCAIRKAGTLACWGDNAYGQLGPGAGNDRKRNTPVPVPGLTGVVEVTGGEMHTCVRLSTGRVSCWGGNDQGQVTGRQGIARVPQPSPVRGVSDGVDLGLGAAHTCVARATGEVACWGTTEYGALGPYRLI